MDTELNESSLKAILLNLDRKYNENQKLRIKHSEEPSRFVDSEIGLFEALDQLQSIATKPELYQHLISRKGSLSTLISLIGHENADVSAKVILMLQEITDIDDSSGQEATENMIKALLEEKLIDLVVSNLSRLDENNKNEYQAMVNSLAIIENIIDYDSMFASKMSSNLINWMMKQLSKYSKAFHPIKLAIAELLSVLLMNATENKNHLRECNGIDVILKQIDYYRGVAPETGDEHEFLEQAIDCLCNAVMDCDTNKESFYEEEGVDLIRIVLSEKRDAVRRSNIKLSILKLFNHLLTTDKNQDSLVTKCCERFIERLGLKVLFPIFNNPKIILNSKVKKREYHQVLDDVEEHTSAIILTLLKYCLNTDLTQRILIKFAENNFEKLDRLVQLHDKYFKLVSILEDDQQASDEHDDDESKDNKSKSSVHFTLRTIDYILLLTYYLADQFETYDPTSGETFSNYFTNKILGPKRVLKHQIVLEVRKHIEEVEFNSLEEKNSLELLLDYFEGKREKND